MNREHGVDRAKAVAIACVPVIHALAPWGLRTDRVGQMMPYFTEWAVPAFFITAGYLRARSTPYPPRQVSRWLTRLLPSYLVASVLAWLFRVVVMSESLGVRQVVVDLLTGNAWGTYYFVPLFLGALVFSILLARFPRAVPWVAVLTVTALVVTRIHIGKDPFGRYYGDWGIARSPFFWWGYFVAGWFVKQRVADRYPRQRVALIGAAMAVGSIFLMSRGIPGFTGAVVLAFCRVGVALGLSTALIFASQRPVGFIGSTLSKYSYEIYLFHFFAIIIARMWGYNPNGIRDVFTVWLSAILCGLALGVPISRAIPVPASATDGAAR